MWEALLAQAAPTPVPVTPVLNWEQILTQQGPLWAVFAVLLYFVVWYGPGLLNGHRVMMQKMGDSGMTTAKCLETLTESDAGTKRALVHVIEAGKEATNCPKVHGHLDRARNELDR